MGAKITLTGKARGMQRQNNIVSFRLVTGPTTKSPPRGLKLFGQVTYRVQCSHRQWNRVRASDDNSDLLVEGYCEPRQDPATGKLYIAVVAMSLRSMKKQNEQKLKQLSDELEKAKAAYQEAKAGGASRQELEPLADGWVVRRLVDSLEAHIVHPRAGQAADLGIEARHGSLKNSRWAGTVKLVSISIVSALFSAHISS